MGGFFGAVGKNNILSDVYFGTDYHSHLGTRSAGLAVFDAARGLQRKIHNIGNSPFRTKFEHVFDQMGGTAAIGCINDTDPQPLLMRSGTGMYALCFVGVIRNAEELAQQYIETYGGQFGAMSGGAVNTTDLLAAYISRKPTFAEGIRYAQEQIDGTANILLLTDKGTLIAARDYRGRIPVHIGKREDAMCASFESFAYHKLGYEDAYALQAGEVVELSADGMTQLLEGKKQKRICSFLWSYYGFSTATYEGVNVETMRYRNGEIMAKNDRENGMLPAADCVAGVPDSGTPHAIGYANQSHLPFARPFIKYTPTWPRSFMPSNQAERNRIAKMKQIPVDDLIKDKELLFVDDSIVRGTQLRETVDFLYESGAKKVHMRSACPPIMYGCQYLNFSRATGNHELITTATVLELEGEEGLQHLDEYSDGNTERGRAMRQRICEKLHLASLEFQTLEGLIQAIGLPREELCTYCWNGEG